MKALLPLLRGEGRLGRLRYAVSGFLLLALKHVLDLLLATEVMGQRWALYGYWLPLMGEVRLSTLNPHQVRFLLGMVALALPFIWVGICLTLARLRDAALPAWLVLLFFVPFLNLLFFAFLISTPSRPPGTPHLWAATERGLLLDRMIPRSASGSALAGALLPLVFGGLVSALSTNILRTYGWGLFVGVPFAMGFASVLIYTYHAPRSLYSCLGVALLSPALLGLAFLAFALEGIICILMAAPLALPLAAMGGVIACFLQRLYRPTQIAPAVLGALLFGLPLGITLEHAAAQKPQVFSVTTSVEVVAPPEVVWPNVIAFAELPPPPRVVVPCRRGLPAPRGNHRYGPWRGASMRIFNRRVHRAHRGLGRAAALEILGARKSAAT